VSGYLGGILSRHLGLVPVVRPRTGGYFGPPRPRAVWPIATDATPAVETRGPRVGEVEHSARRGELQAVRPAMPAKWRRPGGRHTKSTSPADAPRPEPAGPRADRVAVAAPEADYGDRADEIGVPTLATAATAPAASPLRQAHSPPTVGPRARPSRTAPPAVVAERSPEQRVGAEPPGPIPRSGGVLQPVTIPSAPPLPSARAAAAQTRIAPYAEREPAVRGVRHESGADEGDRVAERSPEQRAGAEPPGPIPRSGGVLRPVTVPTAAALPSPRAAAAQTRVAPYADREPAARRIQHESDADEADRVEVIIGRVEVRAVPSTAVPSGHSPAGATTTMTLEEYLRRRAAGSGR